jgi:ABC-2 type transport system permease protein
VAILAAGLCLLMFESRPNIAAAVALTSAILFAASFALQPSLLKDILTSRKSLLWANDVFLVLAILGIGVLLTYIGHRRNIRYDFTRDKLFSISDATIKAVRGLKQEVTVTAFFAMGSVEYGLLNDLLKEYKRQSDRFQFRMVDPIQDPMTTKAMNVRAMATVVVQCGSNRKDIPGHEMFIRPHPMRGEEGGKPVFAAEQQITSAIINVTSGPRRTIQFVRGHGESGINSYEAHGYAAMQEFLTKENYEVGEISLLEDGIGTDTSVLAIISPKTELHQAELDLVKTFVRERKGSLLVALDPDAKCPEFERLLTELFGVSINKETIIDPRGFQSGYWTVAPTFHYHAITEPLLAKNLMAIMFHVRGMSFEKRDTWAITPFLKTIDQAYAKRNPDDIRREDFAFNPATDVRGPLNIGLALSGEGVATGTRAVLLGDGDFATNALFQKAGNTDLFINIMNWVAGQEQLISVRTKTIDLPTIDLPQETISQIFYLCVLVTPLLIVMIGGAVWLARRRV